MNINNLLNNENFIQDFFKFDNSSTNRPVVVSWNGTGIHTIAGPTPFVDISKTFNTNEAGILESIVHTINLTGKIFKSEEGGIANVVSGIVALENLFKGCARAPLEIKCDNNIIFSASGVKVNAMSFNKTNDNWVQSADYNIDLEYKTRPSDDAEYSVENMQESWSIEPLDDVVYTKFSQQVSQRSEEFNPLLKPRSPSLGNPAPSTSVGGGAFGGGGGDGLQIFNIPQFRITRRLSAKGLSPPKTDIVTDSCLKGSELAEVRKTLFLSAKYWVDKQASIPFNSNNYNGIIYFTNSPNVSQYDNTWLYNHTRTVNADIYGGTYETNDTWIAMPTGIPYIETFTVEASTDAENTRTIRVAGNVQGLSLSPTGMMGENYTPLSTGTFNTDRNTKVDLSYSLQESTTRGINHKVPSLPGDTNSHIQTIQSEKYKNALDGWLKDIKPYLYRRACLGANTSDRTSPPYKDPNKPPPNPTYLKENLLNVIPTSTSEGHDPLKGTISYSHEFNNKLQIISGVLSENVRISNTGPANNIQETQILGRALGPLLSSAGSTNPRKTITVDIVVPKGEGIKGTLQTEEECPMYYRGHFWKTIDQLIQGNAPFANRTNEFFKNAKSQEFGSVFKDSDSEDWSPTDGRYSRTVSWIYQHCTTDRFYLDH